MGSGAESDGKATQTPELAAKEPAFAPKRLEYSISELAGEFGISLRALRHYQTKGLLRARRVGRERLFDAAARERLALILQGKRLGFTLVEIRKMLGRAADAGGVLPVPRHTCVEQIGLLERQRRELDAAIAELRRIYTAMLPPAEPRPDAASARIKVS